MPCLYQWDHSMPKELFEIRTFDKGIGLSVDPKDLNQDAASYSLNVEPQSISGELSGIPQDIDVATSISEPIASATFQGRATPVIGVKSSRSVIEPYDLQNILPLGIDRSSTYS